MFKKSRRNIVLVIMSTLVLLWVGTLGVIYVSSYLELSRQNRQMLRRHADLFILQQPINGQTPGKPVPDRKPDPMDLPAFQLSTFYTVAMTYDGEWIEVNNAKPTVHSDQELENLAFEIVEKGNTEGTEKNLVFCMVDKGGYLLVAFMDNTILHESMTTLFRYTLLFGGLAICVFFFFSVFLARKIVRPLEESYQKQRRFISDAGHELKTPISVISANTELLLREIKDNPWLSNIQYENKRMGSLVQQLLELTRAENVLPKMEKIHFSRLVNGEALPFESVAFEKDLILRCDVEKDLFVEGNSVQLKQLVSILLDNAICHSMDGREICLTLHREHGYAELSVINSGTEIPEKQREQLFERFYRIDAARDGDDGHYGLGLAIAKAIVSAHKGKMEILCYNGFIECRVQIPRC